MRIIIIKISKGMNSKKKKRKQDRRVDSGSGRRCTGNFKENEW